MVVIGINIDIASACLFANSGSAEKSVALSNSQIPRLIRS